MKTQIFVRPDLSATFTCSKCGKTNKKDVSSFISHQATVQLKVKCKCGNIDHVVLQRRKNFRKKTNFDATVLVSGEKIPATVEDLSKNGIKMNIHKPVPLEDGDRVRVRFTLDDKTHSSVLREVEIIKGFSKTQYGCEFTSYDHYDNLGQYFLFHF